MVLLLLMPLVALGGERELWSLWQKHQAAPEDHAVVVKACRAYAAANPNDPFLPVVHGIEAWRLLRAEQLQDGVRRLSPYLKDQDDALGRGAQRLSRAWITRLQRERVVKALQHYYREEVRYPPDLQTLIAYPDLPGAAKLPLQDAWQKPWRYRLVGFDGVPGFRDQKYELESSSIQSPFDLDDALSLTYAKQIVAQATRVSRTAPVVKLETPKETTISEVGKTVGGLYIAYAGKDIVILCDTLHWKVLPWKRQ